MFVNGYIYTTSKGQSTLVIQAGCGHPLSLKLFEIFRCAKPLQVLSVNGANDQTVLILQGAIRRTDFQGLLGSDDFSKSVGK